MPNIWPFGRKKKKKLALAEEKLQEKRDDRATHAQKLTVTTKDKDNLDSYDNTTASFKPLENERPLQTDQNVQNIAEEHTLHKSLAQQGHQQPPSIASFHQTEPLVEIEHLAGSRENGHFFSQAQFGSLTSLQPENNFTTQPLYGVPTLKSKRSSATSEILRSRTNRSKASDKEREREIRALPKAIPIPKRPASFSSGLLARDTKSITGGLNRKLHRPTSEISLPMVESLRTSFSGESGEQRNYRVTPFDALSPRPTIRYGENPHRKASLRGSTRKEKGPAIPEEPSIPPLPPPPSNPRARMNDLADNLDAKAIRELMERDQRRRDRKKGLDHEKLQRKLQKKLDKQKAEEAAQTAPTLPIELATSPAGLEGPDPTTNIPIENKPDLMVSSSRRGTESSVPWTHDSRGRSREDLGPFVDPRLESRADVRISSEQASIRDDAIIESATAIRLSTISMSPPTSPFLSRERTMSPSNLSSVAMASQDSPEPTSSFTTSGYLSPEIRREPESTTKQGSSWTSIFRRSGTKRKVSLDKEKEHSTASEFSNVSRESFLRKNPPASVPVVPRSFQREGTVPQRKLSKFREDLPELPISPPRSRLQSPEVDRPLSPYVDDTRKLSQFNNDAATDLPIEDVHPALRDQVAHSRQQSFQGTVSPDPVLLSQSLASIDSEGSWLSSGRPPKRTSMPIESVRESLVSLVQPVEEEPDFSRRDFSDSTIRGAGGLTSQLHEMQEKSPRAEPNFPYDEAVKYDTVKGRKPNIVQRETLTRSREGLLEEYIMAEDDSPVSPLSPGEVESPTLEGPSILRATSVTLGRSHARQLSAGSARLLDIPARSSSDAKRSSTISAASTTKSPLTSPQVELSDPASTQDE